LDFGDCGGQHFALESGFGVETETFSWTCTTGSSGALFGLGLGDGRYLETIHLEFCVVGGLFDEAGVDYVVDSVDCDGSFGDVGCDYYFAAAWRWWFEYSRGDF
jgi:hypothetical protein